MEILALPSKNFFCLDSLINFDVIAAGVMHWVTIFPFNIWRCDLNKGRCLRKVGLELDGLSHAEIFIFSFSMSWIGRMKMLFGALPVLFFQNGTRSALASVLSPLRRGAFSLTPSGMHHVLGLQQQKMPCQVCPPLHVSVGNPMLLPSYLSRQAHLSPETDNWMASCQSAWPHKSTHSPPRIFKG